MSETVAAPAPDDKRPHPRGSVRAYWRLAGDYWKGATAFQAWSLTLISLVLVVGNIVVQYGINIWNRSFFNALQARDKSFAYQAIALFLGAGLRGGAGCGVAIDVPHAAANPAGGNG